MDIKLKVSPHIRADLSTQEMMFYLTLALLLIFCISCGRFYFLGSAYLFQALSLFFAAQFTSFITEIVYALILKKDIKEFILTSFPWVTPLILVLMVPVNTKIYAIVIATFIAVFFGKLVFGGFGQNVFNPAAVGRAVIFTSFAGAVSEKIVLSPTPTKVASSAGWLFSPSNFATFLNDFGKLNNFWLGNYDGAIGETFTLLILILGILLALKKVIDWYIPFVYIGIIFVSTFIIGLFNGYGFEYALFSIATGGVMFGAIFMLTDPVTNPNSRAGKIIFACLAAFFTMLIRYLANLPEGVLYAILLVNMLAPTIDHFMDGKVYLRQKLDLRLDLGFIFLAIFGICLLSFGLKPNEYKSISIPSFERGQKIIKDELEFIEYRPQLVKQLGNSYTISINGFAINSKMSEDAKQNVITVIMNENGSIKEIKPISINDTKGIGDKVINEGFLYQFNDKSSLDNIDALAGATFTSKSLYMAGRYILEKAYLNTTLSDNFAIYNAEIIKREGNDFTIQVKGFGTLHELKGNYQDNKFLISVKDNKIAHITCLEFNDTEKVGELAISTENLNKLIGKDLKSKVDVVSGASFTSRSSFAACQKALESGE